MPIDGFDKRMTGKLNKILDQWPVALIACMFIMTLVWAVLLILVPLHLFQVW